MALTLNVSTNPTVSFFHFLPSLNFLCPPHTFLFLHLYLNIILYTKARIIFQSCVLSVSALYLRLQPCNAVAFVSKIIWEILISRQCVELQRAYVNNHVVALSFIISQMGQKELCMTPMTPPLLPY